MKKSIRVRKIIDAYRAAFPDDPGVRDRTFTSNMWYVKQRLKRLCGYAEHFKG